MLNYLSSAYLENKYYKFLNEDIAFNRPHILYKYNYLKIKDVEDCCGELFISNLCVYNSDENKHIAHKLIATAIRIAELGEYSSIKCIVPKSKLIQENYSWEKTVHILEKFGFKELKGARVKNKRTNNILRTYQLKLIYPKGLYAPKIDFCPFIKPEMFEHTYGVIK